MTIALIGLAISACVFVALMLLFRHERKRGERFAEHARARADLFVLKTGNALNRLYRYLGKDLIRQTGHYFFHTILRSLLALVKRVEKGVRNAMRVNKSLAKRAEEEGEFRSRLEEIALHKASSALSEKEKREHKERSLRGF